MDRSLCGQKIFGGCMGDGCERQCSATIYIPADKTEVGRHILDVNRWLLIGILVAILPIFILAASAGLAREERAHQIERV